MKFCYLIVLSMIAFSFQATAKTVRYELVVKKEKINLSGKKEVDFALTVNGGIPAPTLEFTEGDDAEILVKNELPEDEVSIHWHGILLPPEEDGVPYVNTPPIHPGESRLFKFHIRQNGTYWYHSHTSVQEQKGVYGGILIHPKKKAFDYDKDVVVVLSDWTDENATQVLRKLRKDGDYYLYKKDAVRSYIGALVSGGLGSHLENEWIRMGGMDLSDVGYDAFLINGKENSQLLKAKPGEKIRIRIINAGASSYFYVSLAGLPMVVVSADGVDIEPMQAKKLLMGMAETYDILFTVPEHKNYELRATAQDVSGYASAWIGEGEKVKAPDQPAPNIYAGMKMGHSGHNTGHKMDMDTDTMGSMDHGEHQGSHGEMAKSESSHEGHQMKGASSKMKHKGHGVHEMSKRMSIVDEIDWSTQSDAMLRQNSAKRDFEFTDPITEMATVKSLKSLEPTTLPKEAKRHNVKLVLNGDMERYVWHINGKAINQDRLLLINKGEVVRFTFKNKTMMHHPMHFHGHFFRVINKNGEYSPLKHTVDVPPHNSVTIEFYANEPGQWMLHCHNLYHLKTGMGRVVRYNDFKFTPEMKKYDKQDPHRKDPIYTYTMMEAASSHARAQLKLMRTWDELDFKVESANIVGNNFSFGERWETEGDLFYRRWFTRFVNVFVGPSVYDEKIYGTFGVGYILPMLIDVGFSLNHEGRMRFDVEKRFQWTRNIFSDAEFTWRPNWNGERDTEYEVSLMYGPSWHWAVGLMATEKNVGVGGHYRF